MKKQKKSTKKYYKEPDISMCIILLIMSLPLIGFSFYFLFLSGDVMTTIILTAILTYSLGMFCHGILPLTMPNKQLACKIVSQIYAGGFLIYLIGFLIIWDYYTIKDGNWKMAAFSLIFWAAGIYLVKRNFFTD